ncbi:hypothetical protein L2E82_37556 [Cichorium intybus]|uniref:Uncharacterized protein n=1 Tax=Cichorium intybus TaxID=13427 RepID=A0ACB9AEU8_CICIN|nr:hypothetical protein L2E82_37556 [Cichorium intybus]
MTLHKVHWSIELESSEKESSEKPLAVLVIRRVALYSQNKNKWNSFPLITGDRNGFMTSRSTSQKSDAAAGTNDGGYRSTTASQRHKNTNDIPRIHRRLSLQ